MQTYVYSLHTRARLAHIGGAGGAMCGLVFVTGFRVSADYPPGRALCARCAATTGHPARRADAAPDTAALDAAVIAALLRGHGNPGVARELRVGLRTAVRYVNEAQARAGARTRFQFGYVAAGGTLDR